MKAIVKYLPIEGKWKGGDYVLTSTGELIKVFSVADGKPVVPVDIRKIPDGITVDNITMKLVKPFAVTQDFEVGDEVYDLVEHTKQVVYENNIEYFQAVNRQENTGHVRVKVLGEISPNATWVKDGDEVEVEIWYDILDKHGDLMPSDIDGRPRSKDKAQRLIDNLHRHGGEYAPYTMKPKDVFVKCPTCNTFH